MKKILLSTLILLLSPFTYAQISSSIGQKVISELQSLYTAEFRAKGLGLRISINNQDSSPNASMRIYRNQALLNITKGLFSHPQMTEDTLRLVICHEFGHVFGGAPKTSDGHWSSVEGQSDYYATSKCMKKLIPENENQKERILKASLNFAQNVFNEHSVPVSLNQKSTIKVFKTNTLHAEPQCRLDTLSAGFYCIKNENDAFNNHDPNIGACLHKSTNPLERVGARPRCWYRPPTPQFQCESTLKMPLGSSAKIPVLKIMLDDYREDQSFEANLIIGLMKPADHTSFRLIGKTGSQVGLNYSHPSSEKLNISISKELFDKLKSKTLIPFPWDDIDFPLTNEEYIFQTLCKPM